MSEQAVAPVVEAADKPLPNLTLERVRAVCRLAFGPTSYVASIIERVKLDENFPTAAFSILDRTMYVNPVFARKYLKTDQHVFCLLAHEMMHPLFAHFSNLGELANIAQDMIINSIISTVMSQHSDNGVLMRDFYKASQLYGGLLRPGSEFKGSPFNQLYTDVWSGKKGITSAEVLTTMKILMDAAPKKKMPALLGNHGEASGSGESENEPSDGDEKDKKAKGAKPKDEKDEKDEKESKKPSGAGNKPMPKPKPNELLKIANDLKNAAGGKRAGIGGSLFELFMELMRRAEKLNVHILSQYSTKRKFDEFKMTLPRDKTLTMPFPISPDKRSMTMLGMGLLPTYYRNRIVRYDGRERVGYAVYVDVSGSVEKYLPKMMSMISATQMQLKVMFVFSTKISQVDFDEVRKTGKLGYETTGGTDFSCIAEHILEHKFDKAIVFTDGEAGMRNALQDQLKEAETNLLTVLFDTAARDHAIWKKFGYVINIDDLKMK